MNDLDRLAEAVAADPGSLALRLVCADALEESGQPHAAEEQKHLARTVPWTQCRPSARRSSARPRRSGDRGRRARTPDGLHVGMGFSWKQVA